MEVENYKIVGDDLISLNKCPDNKTKQWYVAFYKLGDDCLFVHEHDYEEDARTEFESWRHMEIVGKRTGGRYNSSYLKSQMGVSAAMGRLRFKEGRT